MRYRSEETRAPASAAGAGAGRYRTARAHSRRSGSARTVRAIEHGTGPPAAFQTYLLIRRLPRPSRCLACGPSLFRSAAICLFLLILLYPGAGCGTRANHRGDADGFVPASLTLHHSGELRARAESLHAELAACRLCPRNCGVNRLAGERGFCRAGAEAAVSSHHAHFGEERPLVGKGGSGTIFFANCALRCAFCINWQVAHAGQGSERSVEQLAAMMLELQRAGCSNINLVTPGHYLPQILLALDIALGRGLRLPVVYNSSGYERLEVLRLLDGIVDVYLPDFKYADSLTAAAHLAGAGDYERYAKATLLEMQRQVGTARPDPDGLVRRGLIVRHLVMPDNAARTDRIINWIAENLPKDTYINIMGQYIPVRRASDHPRINRRITGEEYAEALRQARDAGLTNLYLR